MLAEVYILENDILKQNCKGCLNNDIKKHSDSNTKGSPSPETANTINQFTENLTSDQLTTTAIGPSDPTFKWKILFPASSTSSLYVSGSISTPETTQYFDILGLYEGGGNYENDVYRWAKDCLMRKMLGNSDMSAKLSMMNFCPICTKFLEHKIGELF